MKYLGTTTNLRNHPKRHTVYNPPSTPTKTGMKQATLTSVMTTPPRIVNETHERFACAIANWIVIDCLPLSAVDSDGFREIISVIAPTFKVPCRQTIRARIEKKYDEERRRLLSQLEDVTSVAITTDTWTSNSTQSYMTVQSTTLMKTGRCTVTF